MTHKFLYIPVIFGLSIEVYLILFFIFIPTFFFWKWLLKKYIKVEKTRKIMTWLATLILLPIIYSGLIILFVFGISYTPNKNFDKTRWVTDKEERYQMADDIIRSKMLIGKDTNQVKSIIGEPPWRDEAAKKWTYNMGCGGGGLGFLFHNLDLNLDKNGIVISVEHIEIKD
jgi:hypothetical protein